VKVKNEKSNAEDTRMIISYKDDCLPVTICYTCPLPESGFDSREKIDS
jgi:hypothetical protein